MEVARGTTWWSIYCADNCGFGFRWSFDFNEEEFNIIRGAEAGGILGANTPHFIGLTTPTFWGDLKMGAGGGLEKNIGGKKIFRV